MNEQQTTPEQMTPEQALNFLDSIVSQCKNPALNRQETVLSIQAVQVLRAAIAPPGPADEPADKPDKKK